MTRSTGKIPDLGSDWGLIPTCLGGRPEFAELVETVFSAKPIARPIGRMF